MLATPADLEDLATGFTLSEAVVERGDEIRSVEVARAEDALEVRIGIAAGRFSGLLRRRRNLAGAHAAAVYAAPRPWNRRSANPCRSRPRLRSPPPSCMPRSASCAAGRQINCAHRQRARRRMGAARHRHPDRARGRRPAQRARQGHRRAGARAGGLRRGLHDRHQPRELRDGAEISDRRRAASSQPFRRLRHWRCDSPSRAGSHSSGLRASGSTSSTRTHAACSHNGTAHDNRYAAQNGERHRRFLRRGSRPAAKRLRTWRRT